MYVSRVGLQRRTGEPRYFLSRYKYRYLNGISLYRKTTKYFSSKIKKLLYQHSEITVLISFMTPYPSASPFLAAGLRHCLVSLRMLPITYFSLWRHESMHSCNKLSADTVSCAPAKTGGAFFSFGSSYSCVIFYHLLIIINGN